MCFLKLELKQAIVDLHQIILTRPITAHERQGLMLKHVAECASETDLHYLMMFSASKSGNRIEYSKSVSFTNETLANFYIVLEANPFEHKTLRHPFS